MTKRTLARIIVIVLIMLVLGGASLIIAVNGAGSGAETPAGYFH